MKSENVGVFGQFLGFPTGWARTYPKDMELSASDPLAVSSGAWERHCQNQAALDGIDKAIAEFECVLDCAIHFPMTRLLTGPSRAVLELCLKELRAQWNVVDGRSIRRQDQCWVEPLAGVPFDDVDVVYLDWLYSERHARAVPEDWWDRPEAHPGLIFWDFKGRDGKSRVNPFYYALEEYRFTHGDRWVQHGGSCKPDGTILPRDQFDTLDNYLDRKLQKKGLEDKDGFVGGDGWVDRGLINGRVLIRAEFFDREIPDRSPWGQLRRFCEPVATEGPECEYEEPKQRRVNGRFAKAVEPNPVESRVSEGSDIVLVPMREAFATWFRLRVESGITEEKITWDVGERERKQIQLTENGKTYVFPARYVPVTGETLEFHDRWAWAALDLAVNEIQSLRLGIQASGPAAMDSLEECHGLSLREKYERVKGTLARLVGDCARAVYFHWETRKTSAYSKLLTDRLIALQRASVAAQKELHAAVSWDGVKEERYKDAELDIVELARRYCQLTGYKGAAVRRLRKKVKLLNGRRVRLDVAMCFAD